MWIRYLPSKGTAAILYTEKALRRMKMRVVLKHELNRVKNGYAARSPELGLAANAKSH